MLKGLLILVLSFFYFYNTKFTFLPIYTYQIVICLSLLYLFLNKNSFYFEKKINLFLLGYSAVFLYLLFNFSIYGFEDIILIKKWIIFLIKSYIGIYLLSLILKDNNYSFTSMIKLLQFIIFIHACLMLLYFFNIDFKEWTLQYIPQSGGNIDHAKSFRSRGIVSSSGATLALLQSFGLLFTTYLITTDRLNLKKVLYYGLSFITIIGSIIVSGRTGLVMFPMLFLYTFLLYIKDKESSKILIKSIIILSLMVVSLLMFYIYKMDVFSNDNMMFLKNWFSNEVKIIDGKIEVYTLNVLAKQWLFPQDLFSFIFGDTATWNVARIKTDIGYLRVLNALGIVGCIILYSFFLFIFVSMAKRLKDQRNKAMIITLGVFLFIAEYKEPFFLKVMISSLVMLLYFSSILLKEKSE